MSTSQGKKSYRVTVQQMDLDVAITPFGGDYFIDSVEPATCCCNLWPLISGSDIEDKIREAVGAAMALSDQAAYCSMVEEHAEAMRMDREAA